MAGIGFELQRLKNSGSFAGALGAYAYAGIISSGPWIVSIVSLIWLVALLQPVLPVEGLQLFTTTVTYCYAMALVLVGPLQLVIARYAADQAAGRKPENIFPSCMAALVVMATLSAAAGAAFFLFATGGVPYAGRVAACSLLVYISCIFITADFLTALADYKAAVAGFCIGYGASCAAAYWGGRYGGASGALCGFAAGHAVLLLALFGALARGLGGSRAPDWGMLAYIRIFPGLVLCGFLYNLGMWMDKIMFWMFSSQHVHIGGLMYAVPDYDKAIYLSLLSIVPGLTVFFLDVETDFALHFKRFFEAVLGNGSLDRIVAERRAIAASLNRGIFRIFKVQAIVTGALVLLADRIAEVVGIGAVQLGIFRITLFGTFLLVIFLALLTSLFYADDRKSALACCGVFVAANALLSYFTLKNEAWYGFGFVIAAGLAMILAGWRVNRRLGELEYHIFAAQR